MLNALPPGPGQPRALQTVAWWTRPVSFLESNRRRYGKRFTMRLLQTPPFVMLSDPDEVREVFTAPPDVLHPGEGARILEPVVGRNSVILLDESSHLEQRKLMLPAFHGEKMQRLSGPDVRGGRARGRRLAARPAGGAPPAASVAHARGDPARRVRARPR